VTARVNCMFNDASLNKQSIRVLGSIIIKPDRLGSAPSLLGFVYRDVLVVAQPGMRHFGPRRE